MGRLTPCGACGMLVKTAGGVCPHCDHVRPRGLYPAAAAVLFGVTLVGCPDDDDSDSDSAGSSIGEPLYGEPATDTFDPTATDGATESATSQGSESGGVCAATDEICYQGMGMDGEQTPCCDQNAECALECTDAEPPSCTGTCIVPL